MLQVEYNGVGTTLKLDGSYSAAGFSVNNESGGFAFISYSPALALVSDLATAETEINTQADSGHQIYPSHQSPYYLDDGNLVKLLAGDVADLSQSNYTIKDGYIFETGYPDTQQCVALVLGLDNSLPQHPNGPLNNNGNMSWTNGQQVDLNGGDNPNIAPGTPIATFVSRATNTEANLLAPGAGVYPRSDEHAGIFLGYGTELDAAGKPIAGFFMMDQYVDQPLNPANQRKRSFDRTLQGLW